MANPTLLTMPMCVNADKNTIPPTDAGTSGLFSEEYGWQNINSLPLASGGKAPNRRDFNGVFALLGGIAYACQRGQTFEWVATLPYLAGCVVKDPLDGNKYNAKNDVSEGGTNPSLDPTNWELANGGGDGLPVGAIIAYAGNGQIPEGYLLCDGNAVSRTMFPDLFTVIGTTYGSGDGSTTFNLPDSNQAKRFLQGDTVAGQTKNAGLPNITGETDYGLVPQTQDTGAFVAGSGTATTWTGAGTSYKLKIDASKSNSIYGSSATVQPNALTTRYIIKAFDGQTADSALIDITQYANELAGKADRSLSNLTQAGQDSFLERDFTIIYPNGGTESNPANVTVNSRYVETNPYSGYYVGVMPQLYYNGKWGDMPSFINQNGVSVGMLDNDSIIIQTGNERLLYSGSSYQGDLFGRPSSTGQSTLPCRIKVWKIGKIPT